MKTTPTLPPLQPAPLLLKKIEAVQKAVADFYGIPVGAMTSRDRSEPLATRRQVAMYLAWLATKAPFQVLASSFNRKIHGTVMHAVRVVPEKAAQSASLYSDLVSLQIKAASAVSQLS